MKIVPKTLNKIHYWTIDRWVERNIVHGFIGRDLDLKKGSLEWEKLFSDTVYPSRKVLLLKQNHGNEIVELGARESSPTTISEIYLNQPTGDAWIGYAESGIHKGDCVGVLTADCFPVLILAPDIRAFCAVHCGWRGTLNGILELVIDRLLNRQADRKLIEVAIGPGACGCCYEIGLDVSTLFSASQLSVRSRAIESRDGLTYADLPKLLFSQLINAGLARDNIATHRECTMCGENFFSHRREKALAGRQLSFIGEA